MSVLCESVGPRSESICGWSSIALEEDHQKICDWLSVVMSKRRTADKNYCLCLMRDLGGEGC